MMVCGLHKPRPGAMSHAELRVGVDRAYLVVFAGCGFLTKSDMVRALCENAKKSSDSTRLFEVEGHEVVYCLNFFLVFLHCPRTISLLFFAFLEICSVSCPPSGAQNMKKQEKT